MQRVGSNRNPAVDKFGEGKNGFTAGDPQTGVQATTPGAELFDALQEEIARTIEGAGIALDPTKYDQLLTAIKNLAWGNGDRRVASQAEAEAGEDNGFQMTALRVAQAIAARVKQATEAALGVAKVATQVQVDAGIDDAAFITAKKLRFGFAASFTANGYVAFPSWLGGFILQWGSHAATTTDTETAVAFPFTFPGAVYGVVSTFGHNEASVLQTSIVSQTRSITTSGFLSRREDIGTSTGTVATGYIKWLGWGK